MNIYEQDDHYASYIIHAYDAETIKLKFPALVQAIQTRAEQEDNFVAINNRGYLHEIGLGVDKDLMIALSCYKFAADQGNPRGQ